MHSDYLFKDKSHPFHHDSEERIEIFACSHHFVQPIVHFLRIKFLMEISNSPPKAHLPPKKGISGNKNLSNMQGYIYIYENIQPAVLPRTTSNSLLYQFYVRQILRSLLYHKIKCSFG